MNISEFPERNRVYAKDQPQYLPLPCFAYNDPEGTVVFLWKLTWRDLWTLLWTRQIWHRVLTFNQPLQPLMLMLEKPDGVMVWPDINTDPTTREIKT